MIFRNHAFSRRTSSVLVYFPHHHPLTLYMIFHPIFGRTSTLAFSVSDFPFYAAEIQKRRAWIARQGKRHQTPKQIPDINKANTMRRILNIRRKRAGPVPGPTYKRHHNPANNGDAEMRKKTPRQAHRNHYLCRKTWRADPAPFGIFSLFLTASADNSFGVFVYAVSLPLRVVL